MSPSKYISISSDCQVTAAPRRTRDVELERGISAPSADSPGLGTFFSQGTCCGRPSGGGRRGEFDMPRARGIQAVCQQQSARRLLTR